MKKIIRKGTGLFGKRKSDAKKQRKGAVAFAKMWQPLNLKTADSHRQDLIIQSSTVCFLFFRNITPPNIQLLFG
jgi:hypothetical protein